MIRQKTLLLFAAALLAAATALTGCGKGPVVLTKEDADKTIAFEEGDVFRLELEEDPAAGLEWEIMLIDTTVILAKGEPAFIARSGAGGSSGKKVFTFDAYEQGKTPLFLLYRRKGVKNSPPENDFKVMIEVTR